MAATTTITTVMPIAGKKSRNKGRESEPNSWYPTMAGGIGLVVRRSTTNANSLLSVEGIEELAGRSPMRLLQELPAAHPTVGLAQWNALRTMWPAEGWGFRAYKPTNETVAEGQDAGAGTADPAGDKSLVELLKQQPRELGGLKGMACTLTSSLLFTGMSCIECVPFDEDVEGSLLGLRRLWPVDSLTIAFGRPERDSDLQPYQKQRYPHHGAGGEMTWMSEWVPLSLDRFLWTAIDQNVDDPFGLPPYGTAVNEVLADLALMRDLRDAVHNAAWPRMKVGVNLAELHKVAVEVYRITDPKKASEWVKSRFAEVVDYVDNLAPDDNIVCDTSGETKTHEPGSFTGLEGVLQFLRQRLVQALKSLPTLMGINDGSTYNYTSIEWAIYAAGLEAVRDIVMDLIAAALTLHLRLQGSQSIVKPWADKIRTNDALVEANTEEVKIRNSATKEALGYVTHDEASESITKRKAVKPADEDVLRSAAGAGTKADKDESKQTGNSGQGNNKQGQSQEERKSSGDKR